MKVFDNNIYIGCNAQENWELIDKSNKSDMWYHLDSFPSCHVVCNDLNKLRYCAELCKSHSKYKNLHNVKVCYTPINNLIKGDTAGSVVYKSKRKVQKIMI